MGFDFEIQYKEGSTNLAVDALSRKNGAELLPLLLNNANEGLLDSIKKCWAFDPILQQIISEFPKTQRSILNILGTRVN